MSSDVARWFLRRMPSRRLARGIASMWRSHMTPSVRWVNCRVNDVHFRLRVDTGEVYGYLLDMFGLVEPLESYIVRRLLHSGRVMLDIGANIGYYTVLAACACPNGQIYSFEPTPETFAILQENVAANRLTNVHPYQLALGERPGALRLSVYADKAFTSVVADEPQPHPFFQSGPTSIVRVPVTSVDAFLEGRHLRHVDVVKIDVEGYEASVLRGASGLLARDDAPIVLCEVQPLWLQRFGTSAQSVIGYIEGMGYRGLGLRGFGVFDRSDARALETDSFVFAKPSGQEEVQKIAHSYFSGLEGVKAWLKRVAWAARHGHVGPS